MSHSWKQVAGWAGVVYSVIIVAVLVLIIDAPTFSDSAADYRDWFANNETQIAWVTFGLPIAYALVLLFASGLRSFLEHADSASGCMWSRLSFAGAITMVSVSGVGWAVWAVLGLDDVLAVASDGTVTTMFALITVIFSAIVPCGQAAFMGGASVVILQRGVMARWIGWFGVAIALTMFAGSLWRVSGDPEGLLGPPPQMLIPFVVWTLAVAITMIRARTGEPSPEARVGITG